ncbi:SNARE-interacting protein KEULE-like isoform X4 [Rutidosis leptorrhynchoides]
MNNHILKMFEFRSGLLYEMFRSAKRTDAKSNWKVLIMNKVTVKIMSCSCKMADITDGVSLVEDINKRRQPLPTMDAVYYIQPTREKN